MNLIALLRKKKLRSNILDLNSAKSNVVWTIEAGLQLNRSICDSGKIDLQEGILAFVSLWSVKIVEAIFAGNVFDEMKNENHEITRHFSLGKSYGTS